MKCIKIIGMMLIVLLTACSRDGESQEEEKQPAFISVYVYAPEQPMVTRADVGDVAPIDNDISEKTITNLQIWVFEHNTNTLVSYYSPESVYNLNNGDGATYQLGLKDSFTQAETKPHVDVYVVANAASCGFSFDETTTKETLEVALIQKKSDTEDYFGLTTLTDKVPTVGLPMSGVLRNVEVTGAAPVFKIPTVKLMRAISKIRFIFGNGTEKTVKIKSIQLNSGTIPTQEYLFLESGENAPAFHVGTTYVAGKEFLSSPIDDIAKNEDPIDYVYQTGQDAQTYEDLIADGVGKGELTQVGPYYLRESDKILTGSITYDVINGETVEKENASASFEMAEAGDFSRNHTWIVYAYYGVSRLEVVTVVVKDWTESYRSHDVYNW